MKVSNWSGWTYLGRMLCVSGQSTFNHCGHPVSFNGVGLKYEVFGEKNKLNSDAAYMMDRGGTDRCHCNGKFTAPGDSGAPVYELSWDQNTSDHKAAVLMGHHHGETYYKGQNRMVNIKPGQILQGWDLTRCSDRADRHRAPARPDGRHPFECRPSPRAPPPPHLLP